MSKRGPKKGEGGRPPGTPNKATQTVREQVAKILGKDIVESYAEMASLSDEMRARVHETLLPYCLPKLRVVEVKGEIDTKVTATDEVKAVAGWIAEMQSEQL